MCIGPRCLIRAKETTEETKPLLSTVHITGERGGGRRAVEHKNAKNRNDRRIQRAAHNALRTYTAYSARGY